MLEPPDVPRAELLSPGEVLLYAMVAAFPRDAICPKGEVEGLVGLDRKAALRFVFDEFQSARLGRPMTESPDWVAMARALEEGAPLAALPGVPDTDPVAWLARGVKKRPPSPLTWADR